MAKVLSRNDRNRRDFPDLHHVFHTAKERKTWTKLNLTFNLHSRIRSERVDQTWAVGAEEVRLGVDFLGCSSGMEAAVQHHNQSAASEEAAENTAT